MNIKRKPKPCKCSAYDFPHRLDGGKCRELYNQSLKSGYEKDSIDSLGLRNLFAPDNSNPLRFSL